MVRRVSRICCQACGHKENIGVACISYRGNTTSTPVLWFTTVADDDCAQPCDLIRGLGCVGSI